jgi:cell division protein ZapA (FtsZ GTPase activity inhibitor)
MSQQQRVKEKQVIPVISPLASLNTLAEREKLVEDITRLASSMDSVPSLIRLQHRRRKVHAKEVTVALVKMPSGNRYILTDAILRRPSNIKFTFGYEDVRSGLLRWARLKRDLALYAFLSNVPLDRIGIEYTSNFKPRIDSILGLIVFDYFKIVDQLEIYKKMESQLELLTKKATNIDSNTQDILRGIDDLKTSMEMLLATVQTMRDMMLRLSDRLMMVQNLLEKMNTPEARVAREIINTTIQDINKTQEEAKTTVDNLPSFARDNPWLNILSRGRTQ